MLDAMLDTMLWAFVRHLTWCLTQHGMHGATLDAILDAKLDTTWSVFVRCVVYLLDANYIWNDDHAYEMIM